MLTPNLGRMTRPLAMSWSETGMAVPMLMAKPMPSASWLLPMLPRMMAVLMPITWPARFSSGPRCGPG